jgi:hypothetical protein
VLEIVNLFREIGVMFIIGRALRIIAGAMFAVFILTGIGVGAANAQTPGAGAASGPTPADSAFIANPKQLLQQNPNGGQRLADMVQQLALTDPTTFKMLLDLLPNANALQKEAIANGLAQATKIEVLTDQTLAASWQQQIAAIKDPVFQIAASDAFGDVAIGAIGGGPLGGLGGGPSSGGPVTNNTPENFQENQVNSPSFTYTSSVSGSSYNAYNPVSP